MTVHDPRAWRMVLTGGSAGLGEAYLEGWWDVDDLTDRPAHPQPGDPPHGQAPVVDPPRHRPALRRRPPAPAPGQASRPHQHPGPLRPGQRLLRALPRPTMMYSAAVFPTLGRAPRGRLQGEARPPLPPARPAGRRTGRGDRHRVGWLRRARGPPSRRARVTTTTISAEQHAYAIERVAAAGLSDRITVLPRRLPRPHRHLRQARVDRDDRGRRLARARHLLRALPAGCCDPTA